MIPGMHGKVGEGARTLEKYLTARPEKTSATLAPRPKSG